MIILRNDDDYFGEQAKIVGIELKCFARDLFLYANYESVTNFLIDQKLTKLVIKKEDVERRIFNIFDRMFQHYGKTLIYFVLINLFPGESNCKAVYMCSEFYFDRLHSEDDIEIKRANQIVSKFFKSFFKFKFNEMSLEFIEDAEAYVALRIITMVSETEIDLTPIIEEEMIFDKDNPQAKMEALRKINDSKAEIYYQQIKREEFKAIGKDPPEGFIKIKKIKIDSDMIARNIIDSVTNNKTNDFNKKIKARKKHSVYSIDDDYDSLSANNIIQYYESILHNNPELFTEHRDYVITCLVDGYGIVDQSFDLLEKNIRNFTDNDENSISIQELRNGLNEFYEEDDEYEDFDDDELSETDYEDGELAENALNEFLEDDSELEDEETELFYEEYGNKVMADYWYLQKYLEIRALDNAEYEYQSYKCGLIESMSLDNCGDLDVILLNIAESIIGSEAFTRFSQIKPIELQPKKRKGKPIQPIFKSEEPKESKKNN